MKKLLKYMKGYGKECVLGPLFKLLEAAFELLVPLVVAKIVDVGIGGGDSGYIVKLCLLMVALGVIGLVCAVTAQYFAAKAAVGFAGRLHLDEWYVHNWSVWIDLMCLFKTVKIVVFGKGAY